MTEPELFAPEPEKPKRGRPRKHRLIEAAEETSAIMKGEMELPPQTVVPVTKTDTALAAAPQPRDPLQSIFEAARDPQVDTDKMKALMDLYREERAYAAREAFFDAMARARAGIKAALRTKDNTQTKSKYADLEAIDAASRPAIAAEHFAETYGQADCPKEGHYRVTCRLARGGHTEDYFVDIPVDATGMQGAKNKTATHAFGSTMSYGRRYLKCLIWDIPTTDDDGQRAGKPPVDLAAPEQLAEVRAELKKREIPEQVVLDLLSIDSLEEMPSNAVPSVLKKARLKPLPGDERDAP